MRPGLPVLGASRVQARWAPGVLSCSPSPTLTHLSLSHLPSPSHPTRGSHCPISSHFLCVSPFSHVCAAPEVGAVPLGQPAPPLLSVWSGPQPPAQLSLGQERHVSCAPVGKGVGGWGRKKGGQCPWWGEEGYQPSALESLPCPANCHALSRARHYDGKEATGMNVCAFQKMPYSRAHPLLPAPAPHPTPVYILSRHRHTLLLIAPTYRGS